MLRCVPANCYNCCTTPDCCDHQSIARGGIDYEENLLVDAEFNRGVGAALFPTECLHILPYLKDITQQLTVMKKLIITQSFCFPEITKQICF